MYGDTNIQSESNSRIGFVRGGECKLQTLAPYSCGYGFEEGKEKWPSGPRDALKATDALVSRCWRHAMQPERRHPTQPAGLEKLRSLVRPLYRIYISICNSACRKSAQRHGPTTRFQAENDSRRSVKQKAFLDTPSTLVRGDVPLRGR